METTVHMESALRLSSFAMGSYPFLRSENVSGSALRSAAAQRAQTNDQLLDAEVFC